MKYAADFRAEARAALRGNWLVAVLTGFVASLMGAGIATGGGGGTGSTGGSDSAETVLGEFQTTELWLSIRMFLLAAVVVLVIWLLIRVVIGGAGKLGYATFNLKLVDGSGAGFWDLFSQFHRLWDGFCMNFLMALFTFLWSLLFVIPGIVKGFSYAMTPYILAEHPELTATEAITESRRIMDGNKWRLFCLGFSFIGWSLLCALPALIAMAFAAGAAAITGNFILFLWIIPGFIPTLIGYLFLSPYVEAAYAAFYREVSGTGRPALQSDGYNW